MAKRSKRSIVVSMGRPSPLYIKEGRRGPARRRRHAQGGSPTPTGSRTPPFPVWRGRGKEEEGGRKERGVGPPLLLSHPFH